MFKFQVVVNNQRYGHQTKILGQVFARDIHVYEKRSPLPVSITLWRIN